LAWSGKQPAEAIATNKTNARFITLIVLYQEPYHASNQTDDCKSRNNTEIDECAVGLFDALAPSLGEIGTTDFVGHALEVSLSDEKNPAIVGVNLNGAPQLTILIFELWIFLNFCSSKIDFWEFIF